MESASKNNSKGISKVFRDALNCLAGFPRLPGPCGHGKVLSMHRLLAQLHYDYPGHSFAFQGEGNYLLVDGKARYISLSREELSGVDLFTPGGRNYYQALVNMLSLELELFPADGTVAAQLVVRKEEARRYRLQVLAEKMQLGFLEGQDGTGQAFAVEIDDGEHRRLEEIDFLEPEEELEELEVVEELDAQG